MAFHSLRQNPVRALFVSASALCLGSSSVPVTRVSDQPEVPVRSVIMISPSDRNTYNIRARIDEVHNWQALAHAFHRAGARVIHYSGSDAPGGAREVYTRDKAIIIGRYAYMSDPEVVENRVQDEVPLPNSPFPPRKNKDDYLQEMEFVRRILRAQNITPVTVKGAFVEGGNVIVHSSRTIIYGASDENEINNANRLLATINQTQPQSWKMVVAPMTRQTANKRLAFYHLDTFLGREMGQGHTLFYPSATTPEAAQEIRKVFGEDKVITLTEQEAKQYASNYSPIERSVVMPIENTRLRDVLHRNGYQIISPADYGLRTFIDGGYGGPSCKAVDFYTQPIRS